MGQYISFALAVKGPPDFEYKFRKVDLPPDVDGLEGFSELMVRFHREAGMDDLWKQAQPFFDKAIERYHEPVSQAVLEVNAYLRSVTSGLFGRRFQIYLDLLGAPNQIQVRGYADDYYIVITPIPGAADRRYSQRLSRLPDRAVGDQVLRPHHEEPGRERLRADRARAAGSV